MECEQSEVYLPEDVVENIIAMMPYPSIFKARTLSKAWLARLSCIDSQNGDMMTVCPAAPTRFQQLVCDRSKNWEAFCPVCLGEEESYAYNPTSHTWQKIPSTSFVPMRILSQNRKLLTIEGALAVFRHSGFGKEELYVANVLTRSWKLLPTRPLFGYNKVLYAKLVTNTSLQTYKVVLFFQCTAPVNWGLWVQIYNSSSCSWSSKKLLTNKCYYSLASTVYFNGALYMVGDYQRLIAFDIEEQTLTELIIPTEVCNAKNFALELVVCNGNLLTIVPTASSGGKDLLNQVLKIDVSLGTWSEVARGPPSSFDFKWRSVHRWPVVHGDCIYLGVERPPADSVREQTSSRMLAYNVKEDKWSCVPYVENAVMIHKGFTSFSFQPGLNPFSVV